MYIHTLSQLIPLARPANMVSSPKTSMFPDLFSPTREFRMLPIHYIDCPNINIVPGVAALTVLQPPSENGGNHAG